MRLEPITVIAGRVLSRLCAALQRVMRGAPRANGAALPQHHPHHHHHHHHQQQQLQHRCCACMSSTRTRSLNTSRTHTGRTLRPKHAHTASHSHGHVPSSAQMHFPGALCAHSFCCPAPLLSDQPSAGGVYVPRMDGAIVSVW